MRLNLEEQKLVNEAQLYSDHLHQMDRRRESEYDQNQSMMEDYAAFLVRNKETLHLRDLEKKQGRKILRGNVPIQQAVIDKQSAVCLKLAELSDTLAKFEFFSDLGDSDRWREPLKSAEEYLEVVDLLLEQWETRQRVSESLQETIRQQLSLLVEKKHDLNVARHNYSLLDLLPAAHSLADRLMRELSADCEPIRDARYLSSAKVYPSPMLFERMKLFGGLLFRVTGLHSWVCDVVCGAVKVTEQLLLDSKHRMLESTAQENKRNLISKTSQIDTDVDDRTNLFLQKLKAITASPSDAGVLLLMFTWLAKEMGTGIICRESRLSSLYLASLEHFRGLDCIGEVVQRFISQVFQSYVDELSSRLHEFGQTLRTIEENCRTNPFRFFPVSGRTLAKLRPRKQHSLWDTKLHAKHLLKIASYSSAFIHSPRRKGGQQLHGILVNRRRSISATKASPLKSSRRAKLTPHSVEEPSREEHPNRQQQPNESDAESRAMHARTESKNHSKPHRSLARIIKYRSAGVTQNSLELKELGSSETGAETDTDFEIRQLISRYQKQARIKPDNDLFSYGSIVRSFTALKSTKKLIRIKSSIPSVSNSSSEISKHTRAIRGLHTDHSRQRAVILVRKPTANPQLKNPAVEMTDL